MYGARHLGEIYYFPLNCAVSLKLFFKKVIEIKSESVRNVKIIRRRRIQPAVSAEG